MAEDPAFVWDRSQHTPRPMPRRIASTGEAASPPNTPDPPGEENESPLTAAAESNAVLVPLDEWTRILHQLGNLHEAGQQLAEARERAGKAETEATFLRERLKDMRERLSDAEEKANTPPPEPEPLPSYGEWLVRRWLERRKKR